MKTCKICKTTKELDQFHKKAMGKFGVDSVRTICRKQMSAAKYQDNSDKIKAATNAYKAANREVIREKSREYDKQNAEKIAFRKAKYRQQEYVKERERVRGKNNREYQRNYNNDKRKNSLQYRLKCVLRTRIGNFMRGVGQKQGSAVKDLGCTIDELITYLESKFTEGMNWNNYGINGWHVDHVKPLATFDLTVREEFLQACHYTNLQPLWAEDNFRKNRKYDL